MNTDPKHCILDPPHCSVSCSTVTLTSKIEVSAENTLSRRDVVLSSSSRSQVQLWGKPISDKNYKFKI